MLLNILSVSASIKTTKSNYTTIEQIYVTSTVGANDYLCRSQTPLEQVKLYIVNNKDVWKEGDSFEDARDSPTDIPNSKFSSKLAWDSPVKGNYDLIVDCNDNKKYEESIEPIFNSGFTVVPKEGNGKIFVNNQIKSFSWQYDPEEQKLSNEILNFRISAEREDIKLNNITVELATPDNASLDIEIYLDKNNNGILNPVDVLIGSISPKSKKETFSLDYLLNKGTNESVLVVYKTSENSINGDYSLKIDSLSGTGSSSEATIKFFGLPLISNLMSITDKKTCVGSISLEFDPNPAFKQSAVISKIINISGCDGKEAFIKSNVCYIPSNKISCTLKDNKCEININALAGKYYACIDKNNDGDFIDLGEFTSKELLVKAEEDNKNESEESEIVFTNITKSTNPITGRVIGTDNLVKFFKNQNPFMIILEATLLIILFVLILIFIRLKVRVNNTE